MFATAQAPLSPFCTFHPIQPKRRWASPCCLTKRAGKAIFSLAINLSVLVQPAFCSSTPYSLSKELQFGLDNGIIRTCPANNPTCISTTSGSASFAVPWRVPSDVDSKDAIRKIADAILKTQKNAKIVKLENTPSGEYLEAIMDGAFGQDVLEFLVKKDVVTYRCIAKSVVFIYPFTSPFGNSKGQEERLKSILGELGWSVPDLFSLSSLNM